LNSVYSLLYYFLNDIVRVIMFIYLRYKNNFFLFLQSCVFLKCCTLSRLVVINFPFDNYFWCKWFNLSILTLDYFFKICLLLNVEYREILTYCFMYKHLKCTEKICPFLNSTGYIRILIWNNKTEIFEYYKKSFMMVVKNRELAVN